MRRIELSTEELGRVVKLRQGGASWLGIQREAGIPRRVAKRVYEEWEKSQSIEFLQAARRDVAAEEYREHLNSLTGLAQRLIDSLKLPASPGETCEADRIFDALWHTGAEEAHESDGSALGPAGKERRRRQTIRRNHMLFDSLQKHTSEKVDWQALEGWKRAWDTGIKLLGSLRRETKEILTGYLRQEPGLRDAVQSAIGESARDTVVEGVLWSVWPVPMDGTPVGLDPVVPTRPRRSGKIEVVFGSGRVGVGLQFSDADLAQEVAELCLRIAQILSKGDKLARLRQEFRTMEVGIITLEEMLDPLILRPILLHTRCDLCPV